MVEVFNEGRLEVLDELYEPGAASRARAWIAPFLASFSDLELEIVQLVAEGGTVVARSVCSGTHSGVWLGHGHVVTGLPYMIWLGRARDGVRGLAASSGLLCGHGPKGGGEAEADESADGGDRCPGS